MVGKVNGEEIYLGEGNLWRDAHERLIGGVGGLRGEGSLVDKFPLKWSFQRFLINSHLFFTHLNLFSLGFHRFSHTKMFLFLKKAFLVYFWLRNRIVCAFLRQLKRGVFGQKTCHIFPRYHRGKRLSFFINFIIFSPFLFSKVRKGHFGAF